jgi:tetratricopeptide (TPR) repeat protein
MAGVRAATEQRWGEAERFFQIVLQQEPDSASAYSNLGNVHLSEGHPEIAVADFSRAIKIAPEVCSIDELGKRHRILGHRHQKY